MTNNSSNNSAGALSLMFRLVLTSFFAIAGLVLAAQVLVPLALALLIFVLITAIVERIQQQRVFGQKIPKIAAQLLAFAVVIVAVTGILSVFSNQAGAISEALPRYEERFARIASRIVALLGDQHYQAAKAAFAELKISDFASGAISSAGGFLSGVLLVFLYIPFMMVERAPMRVKIALAFPDPEMQEKVRRISQSMSDSLQRYIGIKTFVSLVTSVGSYAVMKPVGLDFAETWAILAFLLNFIPTIGSMIAVILPAVVSLVQFETLIPFLIVVLGCGAVQFVVGNILEPALTGKSLNLSPLMVILSLTFWTAIWGMSGAFLSVPITVCVLIILAHMPNTRAVAVLISGDGNVSALIGDTAVDPPKKAQSDKD